MDGTSLPKRVFSGPTTPRLLSLWTYLVPGPRDPGRAVRFGSARGCARFASEPRGSSARRFGAAESPGLGGKLRAALGRGGWIKLLYKYAITMAICGVTGVTLLVVLTYSSSFMAMSGVTGVTPLPMVPTYLLTSLNTQVGLV